MPGTPRKTTAAKAAPARKTAAAPVRMAGHQAKKTTPPRSAPAPQAAAGGYTLGSAVKETLFDLTMPSGQTCQVRRPGVQGLIAAGVLNSFDDLTAMVQTEHIAPHQAASQRVTTEEAKAAGQELLKDPAKLASGFQMIHKLVVFVVNQPKLWIDYQMTDETPEAWAKRQETEGNRVPVRNVEIADQLFLVQWSVGGSADLQTFREGLGISMDDLAAIQSL